MKTQRILKHLLTTHGQVTRAFPKHTLNAIETAIKTNEATHVGEIRFVVEAALDGMPLFKGQSPRHRSIELFAQLRVWDTEYNNGLLIYVLLADRAVEIVADRGIHAKVGTNAWDKICRQMELAFKAAEYENGVINGVHAAGQLLAQHFPDDGRYQNELQDGPTVL